MSRLRELAELTVEFRDETCFIGAAFEEGLRQTMREFSSDITVEWAHCDAAGIVFYPHYYVWFDQGTERLFRANGFTYESMKKDFAIQGMPLLETGAKYRNPAKLGDDISITSWVDDWQSRTFLVRHDLSHADGRTILEGFERRVFVVHDSDSEKGIKATKVPEPIQSKLSG